MTSQEIPALVGLEEGEGGEAGQVDVLLVDQLRLHADVVDQELAGALHGRLIKNIAVEAAIENQYHLLTSMALMASGKLGRCIFASCFFSLPLQLC